MERAIFEIILEQREEEQKVGWNIATSGQREEEINKWPTSRRLNVATSQCRGLTIIKSKRDQIPRGVEKRIDEGTESRAAMNQISGEDNCFFIFFFPERLLMFYRLIMCITKSSMF